MIASLNDYYEQIQRLIDGDDVSVSEISVNTLAQVVWMAQRRIYREVRSRYNEKAFTGLTVASNAVTIPADFESVSIVHFGGLPLEPVSEEWLREYLDGNPSGDAAYFAAAGSQLLFGPAVADGTAVQGRYFCRLPDLTPDNFGANALIAREPDLFVYAALVEALPFFARAADQAQLFASKYEAIKDRVNTDSSRTAAHAARLVRRPSARMTA